MGGSTDGPRESLKRMDRLRRASRAESLTRMEMGRMNRMSQSPRFDNQVHSLLRTRKNAKWRGLIVYLLMVSFITS